MGARFIERFELILPLANKLGRGLTLRVNALLQHLRRFTRTVGAHCRRQAATLGCYQAVWEANL